MAIDFMKSEQQLEREGSSRSAPCSRCARLREALLEISKGRGSFSIDPLTHATNAVNEMKQLAIDALATVENNQS